MESGGPGLEHAELEVAGVRRGYWLARGPRPGGPQYLPARVVGPIPRRVDATGILLEQVTASQNFRRPVYQVTRCPLRVKKGYCHLTEALNMVDGETAGTGYA